MTCAAAAVSTSLRAAARQRALHVGGKRHAGRRIDVERRERVGDVAAQMKPAAGEQTPDHDRRESDQSALDDDIDELSRNDDDALDRRSGGMLRDLGTRARGRFDGCLSASAGTVSLPRSLPLTCSTSSISSCASAAGSTCGQGASSSGPNCAGEAELVPQRAARCAESPDRARGSGSTGPRAAVPRVRRHRRARLRARSASSCPQTRRCCTGCARSRRFACFSVWCISRRAAFTAAAASAKSGRAARP